MQDFHKMLSKTLKTGLFKISELETTSVFCHAITMYFCFHAALLLRGNLSSSNKTQ